MSMLELTKAELDQHDALTPRINPLTQRIVDAIPFPTVDPRMKAVIAVSQLTAFASQFKRNINLWDGTPVPINAISFVIKGSGYGGDSSVKVARKCFKPGYTIIDNTRKSQATKRAQDKARAAGEELPGEYEVYCKYMQSVPPIDIMPTTGPGLIQHINDIGDLKLSSGFLYCGEFSDELAYNPDMMENIKILSEVYDTGDKEAKYTKGVDSRSGTIEGQPVSALFVGSPGHIIYDEATKKKFHVAFMSKLARRSWFCYTPERIPEPTFDSVKELIAFKAELETKSAQAIAAMSETVNSVTRYGITTAGNDIDTSYEVFELFTTYQRYNDDLVNSLPNQDSTYALIRRHLQWKALKLSGAFALFDQSDIITAEHYLDAMRFCEVLDKDMQLFEHDLNKAPHERFSDYAKTKVDSNGIAIISIHDIKKLGFLQSVAKTKLQELTTLCTGYDQSGIYSVVNGAGAIQYEPIIKTDVLGISYKPINTDQLNAAIHTGNADLIRDAKHRISLTTANGFEVADTTFADLGQLLSGDFAYSPFKFRDGVRGKDNIIGGTKWLVLDIDTSVVTAEEAHFMLSDVNHHVALSSDPSNNYKFRILLELDSVVELSPIAWKHLCANVADDLGLQADPLPQSQPFFSYANRRIFTNVDGEPLSSRDYVIRAREAAEAKEHKQTHLSPAVAKQQLQDEMETFNYAFECKNGTGSRNIFRMIKHAKELGATLVHILVLIDDVNDYWATDTGPMLPERIMLLKEQATRIYQE